MKPDLEGPVFGLWEFRRSLVVRRVVSLIVMGVTLVAGCASEGAETIRSSRFKADSPGQAAAWQRSAREKLFALMMGGREPDRCALDVKVLRRVEVPGSAYVLEEITLQTMPDRRVHAWLARPVQPKGRVGAVLALHGHGGTGEEIVRGRSLYWYGRAMVEMGYVVISPDIGQHELQHTNWTLMGERTWDALRCVDYVVTLPEVDTNRLAWPACRWGAKLRCMSPRWMSGSKWPAAAAG